MKNKMNNLKKLTDNALMNRVYSPNKVVSNEAANELIYRNAPLTSTEGILRFMAPKESKPGVHEFGNYVKEKKFKVFDLQGREITSYVQDEDKEDTFDNAREKNGQFKLDGKSRLYLPSVKDTAVRAPSRKIYDCVIQIFELAGLKTIYGKNPTEVNLWEEHKEKTHIDLSFSDGKFSHRDDFYYNIHKLNSMNLEQFISMNNISKKSVQEIYNWYEEFRPYRKSKGESILK